MKDRYLLIFIATLMAVGLIGALVGWRPSKSTAPKKNQSAKYPCDPSNTFERFGGIPDCALPKCDPQKVYANAERGLKLERSEWFEKFGSGTLCKP
jgi:hypothetical protein